MKAFRALLLTEIRNFTRDRMMLFFTLLFPLVFILLFGFLMGGMGDVEHATLGVYLESQDDEDTFMQTLERAGLRDIRPFDSLQSLEDNMADGQIDFGVVWNGAVLRFIYDPSRLQENYAFQQLANGIGAGFNMQRQDAVPAINVVRIEAGEIESISWFNLVLPGILAFTILSSGLFAISGHLTQMKQRNILDRLIVTPMSPVALLLAIALVRLVVGALSTLITLGVGILVFKLHFTIDWLRYGIFVICSTLGTMGLGTLIALIVRRPSSAGNVANAAAMIMMFMAGIYFPVSFMPAFMRTLSRLMPLTHMANVMRHVTGVLDMSDLRFWMTSAAFLGIALILFPLMARYIVRPLRN
jgi:ABC-2 type transport system permease protein